MALVWQKDIPIETISTFRMGGRARELVTVERAEDLTELFSLLPKDRNWLVIGGGSNMVFPDGDYDTLLIRLAPAGAQVLSEDSESARISAGGGDSWDDVVAFAVAHGFSKIESLSAIPGTAGATPVQNVGAYGTEIKDVLESVRAFDTKTGQFVEFSNTDCKFAYRDSMFKHEGKGRYIITSIVLSLSKKAPIVPAYPGVAEYFTEKGITEPSLSDIRSAITAIRWRKLPDPKDVASVGSFFHNPFVVKEHAEELKNRYPDMKMFPVDETRVKVPAGWLIEQAGFKGKRFGNLSIYKNNALVIVNEGGATREELASLVQTIIKEVETQFGITLNPEPELLGGIASNK